MVLVGIRVQRIGTLTTTMTLKYLKLKIYMLKSTSNFAGGEERKGYVFRWVCVYICHLSSRLINQPGSV